MQNFHNNIMITLKMRKLYWNKLVWQLRKEHKCLWSNFRIRYYQEVGYRDYIRKWRLIERKLNWQRTWTIMLRKDSKRVLAQLKMILRNILMKDTESYIATKPWSQKVQFNKENTRDLIIEYGSHNKDLMKSLLQF